MCVVRGPHLVIVDGVGDRLGEEVGGDDPDQEVELESLRVLAVCCHREEHPTHRLRTLSNALPIALKHPSASSKRFTRRKCFKWFYGIILISYYYSYKINFSMCYLQVYFY